MLLTIDKYCKDTHINKMTPKRGKLINLSTFAATAQVPDAQNLVNIVILSLVDY